MGNSISTFDYEEQLRNTTEPKRMVQTGEADGEFGPIYRTVDIPADGPLVDGFIFDSTTGETRSTLYDMFLKGYNKNPSADFLGTRKYTVVEKEDGSQDYERRKDGSILRSDYVYDSFQEVFDTSHAIGRGLRAIGANCNDKLAILSVNRSEWVLSKIGFFTQSFTIVPLYPTLGPDSVEYIVNHSETKVIVVSKENLPLLLKVSDKIPHVKHIIMFDAIHDGKYGNTLDVVKDEDVAKCKENGITLLGLNDIIKLGNSDEHKDIEPNYCKRDDLAYIMYTSGTTGTPKGVMLTHENISSAIGAARFYVNEEPHVYFSYLPLCHVYEGVFQVLVWSMGGSVCFSQGDVRQLVDDLQASLPTVCPFVPRVLTRFYSTIWSQINQKNFLVRAFIYRAYNYQLDCLRHGRPLDATYDNYVFAPLRQKLGFDRIKILLNGASPCPAYVVEFMRVLTKGFFAQGYGMTETAAGSIVSQSDDYTIGSVGPALGCIEVRLADIPDMNYFHRDNTGEILMSGHAVFKGYYKNEEETKNTLVPDSNGRLWIRTGDVGRLNPNNTISIIDRKKNMIKLSQGEYVSVEKVEDTYGQCLAVGQVWVYGNSYKPFLVGVVVPNIMEFYAKAVSNGWWKLSGVKPIAGSITEEVANEFIRINNEHKAEVKKWLATEMAPFEKELNGFEKIKTNFIVDCDYDSLGQVFNEPRDLLTPTMKKKRKPLLEYYLESVKKMYEEAGEPEKPGERWV